MQSNRDAQREDGGRHPRPPVRPEHERERQKNQRELDDDDALVDAEIETGGLISEPGEYVQKRTIFSAFCKRVAEDLVPGSGVAGRRQVDGRIDVGPLNLTERAAEKQRDSDTPDKDDA